MSDEMPTEDPIDRERLIELVLKRRNQSETHAESTELDVLLERFPELADECKQLEHELDEDDADDAFGLGMRVLFGTADEEEKKELLALQETNPKQWEEFRRMRFILGTIAASAKLDTGDMASEEIPPDVLAKLKATRTEKPPQGRRKPR